ncbi:MAG: site-specific integrase [Tannerellaceae bacterium]|jgi:site-specific recombinase XerD|nr:site-specific integrase [Tannerellaceae bacterium]
MISVKIKLRKSAKEGCKGVLVIQIISKRKVKIVRTGFKLYPHEWDAVQERVCLERGGRERAARLREIQSGLNAELLRLDDIIKSLKMKEVYDVNEISYCFDHYTMSGNMLCFMDQTGSKMKVEGRGKSASIMDTVRRSFAGFLQTSDVRMSVIDAPLMKQYEAYLLRNNLTLNSISCYMRVLRSVYNKAVEEGLSPQKLPFRQVYTGIAKTAKRSVDEYIIQRMLKLDLDDDYGLGLSRDLFMFSFYTRGMAFVDMANLTQANLRNGYLLYERSKTGTQIVIKVEPCIEVILMKYRSRVALDFLLPIRISAGDCYGSQLRVHNKRLGRISRMLLLDKPLSSYTARHSWATIALRKGVAVRIISESMGHSSENTTRIYLASLGQNVIDRANAKVIKQFS